MITIYGRENCSFCRKAKDLVETLELEHEYFDIGVEEHRTVLKEMAPNAKTIPQIWRDGEYIGGYTELVASIEQ